MHADCGSTFLDNKNYFETTLFFLPFLSESLYCIRRIKKIWFGSEMKWSQSVQLTIMYVYCITSMTLIEKASNVCPLECTEISLDICIILSRIAIKYRINYFDDFWLKYRKCILTSILSFFIC